MTHCRVMAIWNVPKCANEPWSPSLVTGQLYVGQSSFANIRSSYTDVTALGT